MTEAEARSAFLAGWVRAGHDNSYDRAFYTWWEMYEGHQSNPPIPERRSKYKQVFHKLTSKWSEQG